MDVLRSRLFFDLAGMNNIVNDSECIIPLDPTLIPPPPPTKQSAAAVASERVRMIDQHPMATKALAYEQILVSNSTDAFPYGSCINAYNASCFKIKGPFVKTHSEGLQSLSFMISSRCEEPLKNGCSEDLDQIKINTSERYQGS